MTPLEKIRIIDEEGEGLTKREIDFIASLIDKGLVYFSKFQLSKINVIYKMRCIK